MNVKISLLNVKDGDAIIIELVKATQALVMVVDGGKKSYYATKMRRALQPILQKHGKKAPDVVVCSHYDSDHIGGLLQLLEEYIADIKQVWVHRTPVLLNEYCTRATLLLEEDRKLMHMHTLKMHSVLNEVLGDLSGPKRPVAEQQVGLLLESVSELKQLIDLIPDDKLVQPFNNGVQLLPDWPEIKILGPTQAYYNSLFPSDKPLSVFLKEERTQQLFVEERNFNAHCQRLAELAGVKSPTVSACEKLKKDNETSLTATNKASIIFAIDEGSNRYLFTGDAGIESFKQIPGWTQEIKGLYFLKVPHHGSSNNLSKELIELMQPTFAYSSGDNYQDDEVLDCLKTKAKRVRSTKATGDISFDSTAPA
jgi:beta-lactamase superfamily II metal-dependent hydrolase